MKINSQCRLSFDSLALNFVPDVCPLSLFCNHVVLASLLAKFGYWAWQVAIQIREEKSLTSPLCVSRQHLYC